MATANWAKGIDEIIEIGRVIITDDRFNGNGVEWLACSLAEQFYTGEDKKRGAARLLKALRPIAAQHYLDKLAAQNEPIRQLQEMGWRYYPADASDPAGPGYFRHKQSGQDVNQRGGLFPDIWEAARITLASPWIEILK